MPKSPSTPAPTSPSSKGPTDPSSRVSDVALRKKKNADAQAAFRARRANYIATLEETVTSLESVVIQLQESCRESRNETMELRQENARLRHENRERERFWRALYQARKAGHITDVDEIPPLSSPFPGHANHSAGHPPAAMISPGYNNGMGYRGDDPTACSTGIYATSGQNGSFNTAFPNAEAVVDGSSGTSLTHRGGKYAPYPYALQDSPREGRYHTAQHISSSLNNGDSITPPHSNTPSYVESPSLTSSEMTYTTNGRFPGEEKLTLNTVLDNAPYVFPHGDRYHQAVADSSVPNSRSMSPTSTTGSSSSVPLTSSFQYPFPDQPPGHERPDFDYRRHSLPQCPEVTLHGGTADVPLPAPTDVRYRVLRRTDSGLDTSSMLPASDHGSQRDQGSSDGGDMPFDNQRSRLRRNTLRSQSRTPSPGPAPISCTVAVIKAQAFGALRRTRTRTKKSSDGAAKVAMDVLEARGIGLGVGSGSGHLQDDDIDLDMEM